jgi:hypothetical protein
VTEQEASKLLIPESDRTIVVSVSTKPFVARDHFVVNISQNAPIIISSIGGNFRRWFLNKIEEPFATNVLRGSKLCKASKDGPIIAELGGEKEALTTLTEIFGCMELQAGGKRKPLLTNGYANIFYVRDADNMLRVVCILWRNGGWSVNAWAIDASSKWSADSFVFFRIS